MIDEWYDRAYLECRAEFHAGILQLMTTLIRSLRKPRSVPKGEQPMRLFIALASAVTLMAAAPAPRAADEPLSLAGTWVMDSAYEIHADGSRTTNYGAHPSGLMMVDNAGRYSIQIFRPGRSPFRSGDKARGEADEYRSAMLGSSTHFGRVTVDAVKRQLLFDVEASSFPNWEGKRQVRDFSYAGGLLSYAVPASASGNGTIAYSVWRKMQ